jgi:hypothetical protein
MLGPFLFTVYTLPLADIIRRHGLKYHLYADETQLYLSFDVLDNDFDATLTKIHKCLNEIKAWMDQNMLKLNQAKTEGLFLTSPHYKNHISAPHFTFGHEDIIPAPAARNIGVIFDSNLIMADHIKTICKSAHYHLRNIGAIRKFITKEACIQLVHAFITSRIDFANSLLFGVSATYLQKLQRVLNIAARIVTLTSKQNHITPILKALHWLPIDQRIKYKILVLTFRALHDSAPSYIKDLLTIYEPTRSLRSGGQNLLVGPPTRLKTYGDRSFSAAAPHLWNQLPAATRSQTSLSSFKCDIKTLLFREAYQ